MKYKNINWPKIKKNHHRWKVILGKLTKELLTNSDRVELSKYNEEGYYHHVPNYEHFKQMQLFWGKERRVPEEWIYKGKSPGIWTSMFSPYNTFSIAPIPVCVIQFHFKDGFFIYDRKNLNHKKTLRSWRNRRKRNPWKFLKNDEGKTLEERLRLHRYPSHKDFYENNSFSAIIGYSDYVSPVIMLEHAIESVEFFEGLKIV